MLHFLIRYASGHARLVNRFDDPISFVKHLMVQETHDTQTFRHKIGLADSVIFLSKGMALSVQFDYESGDGTIKIGDVRRNRVLPPDPKSGKAVTSNARPESRLSRGRSMTHLTGERNEPTV